MILAVDLGSTSFKAALFDREGRRVAESSRLLSYEVRTNERAEISPSAVIECFYGVCEDTVQKIGQRNAPIRRLSLTSQANTFCVCDTRGNAKSPFLSWTDTRAHAEAVKLQGLLGDSFRLHSGWPAVEAAHMIAKVLWWKNHRGLSRDCRVVSLPSYLAMMLGAPHANDSNLAAMSGFYSIPDAKWRDKALDAVGVEAGQLGDIAAPGQPFAAWARRLPSYFSRELQIVFAGNDHTAGAVGCGCRSGRSVMTLGTAGVLFRWIGNSPGPFSLAGLWGPYPGGGYYQLLNIPHACSALDWADNELFGSVDSSAFADRASRVHVGGDLPIFDPARWGSAHAWNGSGSPEQKAYAVLEGIAFAMRALAGESAFAPGEEVVVLGGGSRLDFWMQLVSDIFWCSMTRGVTDGLDGAACLAGVPVRARSEVTAKETFQPRGSGREVLRSRFDLWKDFVSARR